jgi:putative hydrolase of the HAD superfamily
MKLVFSNAPRHYVQGVLRALGLARYFDGVYAIEDARYRGKPALHGFHVLLRKHNLDPHRCALIDDVLENLRTAHRLGMSTVWVNEAKRRVPFVDLRVASVIELPRLVFRYS